MKRIALAAMLGLMAFAPAVQADTTVKYLNIASIPGEVALMQDAVKEYEAAHPGVKIELPFLENEAFKAKLTTLLQSSEAPDIFHSWGGGVLTEQAKAGVLRPIEGVISQEAKDAQGTAGVAAFTRDGHIYGMARDVAEVVIWYNKKLFKQAGVDPASLATWDGFLAGVKKFKDAGITPFALGAKDKWPAHFWWSKLVVRLAGEDEFNDATAGIRRIRSGSGFRYVGPDGETVRSSAVRDRIGALAIPPAWTDVWICPSPNGHIQATGRDARGRKQYRYHDRWRQVRDADKFERLGHFGRALGSLRTTVDADRPLRNAVRV